MGRDQLPIADGTHLPQDAQDRLCGVPAQLIFMLGHQLPRMMFQSD
jgi:hypothetical protein